MSRVVSLLPTTKGLDLTRCAIAMALSRGQIDRHDLAVRRFGEESLACRMADIGVMKAEVAGGARLSGSWGHELAEADRAGAEFFDFVRGLTLIGRIAGLRKIPLQTRLVSAASGFGAAWVAEGTAIPVSSATYDEANLPARKIASLSVVSQELLLSSDPSAEIVIRNDMASALKQAVDTSFLDPANAGVTDVSPASITNGAPAVAATGDGAEDVRNLIDIFGGDLERAVLIGSPKTFARMHDPLILPGLGVRGGNALGIPAFACTAAGDTLTLVDPDSIAFGDSDLSMRVSTEASIEMMDAPSGESTPDPQGTSLVSLFQTDSAAILVDQVINWRASRPGSVACVTGVAQS